MIYPQNGLPMGSSCFKRESNDACCEVNPCQIRNLRKHFGFKNTRQAQRLYGRQAMRSSEVNMLEIWKACRSDAAQHLCRCSARWRRPHDDPAGIQAACIRHIYRQHLCKEPLPRSNGRTSPWRERADVKQLGLLTMEPQSTRVNGLLAMATMSPRFSSHGACCKSCCCRDSGHLKAAFTLKIMS